MRRISFIIACMLVIFVLFVGCGTEERSEGSSFTAIVLENNESSLLVEPVEGSQELRSADRITVSLKDAEILNSENEEITADELEPGKQVEIAYSGGIAESYPAQIQGCYRVKLLD